MQPELKWIPYQDPPIQELDLQYLTDHQVKILVRREDRNHPQVSGNKWWKLKYNLQEALSKNQNTVLTFGGAFSNHIYATAAACGALGLKCVGVIRGEEVLPLNSTLAFARKCGMELYFISRSDYKKKNDPDFLSPLQKKFGTCFIIPEGGTNELAVKGCVELGERLLQHEFNYLCVPVGTGGTMAGIIQAFNGKRKIIGIPVLKNGGFLAGEIQKFLPRHFKNWELKLDYHQGGYATTNTELESFMRELALHNIPTEHVYTGKLFWAVVDLVKKGFFEKGLTVMVLHTGGLRTQYV
jgi:1-aminocyclopropane-1-carboxylate deaminase